MFPMSFLGSYSLGVLWRFEEGSNFGAFGGLFGLSTSPVKMMVFGVFLLFLFIATIYE